MTEKTETVKKELSIYIHIPFCKSKCRYCDFNSYKGMEEYIPAYFVAMEKELSLYREALGARIVKSVFFGGGTPSIVEPELICGFMEKLKECFEFMPDAEATIECNPGTVDSEKFKAYKRAGINRISLGLQCWQASLLKTLGRTHSARDFEISIGSARQEGFSNINVDLIFGIPGQTEEDWMETLDKVIALELPHISCYSLSIEPGTELGIMRDRGEFVVMDDEIDRAMYHYAESRLKEECYRHYEISNFARPGYECLHNLVYWRYGEYLGIGAGAHSYINAVRYSNLNGIKQYIESLYAGDSPSENHEAINIDEQKSEYMIVGLRTGDGICLTDFKNKFGQEIDEVYGDQIEQLVERGLLIRDALRIHLTELGLDLANQVFIEFI